MSRHFHIIIPSHNRIALLRRCLECLALQTDTNFSAVVVNDGSSDGTAQMLAEDFPQFGVIEGDGNLWWTGAVDAGIQALLAKYRDNASQMQDDAVILFNDDLEFDADFLTTIRKLSDSDAKTLIGSVVLNIADRSTIVRGGALMNWWTAKITQLNQGKSIESFADDYTTEVYTVSGRGVLIPLSVFVELGSYNVAHYPQHGDVELPVRAARAGYQLKAYYQSRVYCHFDLENDINTSTHGLRDVKKLLFDQRSYLNLREHFWLAVDTRKNPLQGIVYFLCDLARVSKSVLEKLFIHYTKRR